ncbi:phosphorylase superfamily protein [Fusarium austroafricanum]|uniref:Phosphorylase superfamily protein n=1 Tax=Fusarium austroafricanum TaxID=2364996 RepID=A0A8H4NXL8_9HYPO|nr:phosphorylase superfamily protein [Fusarium austroafricanum]
MASSEYPHRPSRREDFEIAIVCALPVEFDAVALMIDQFWDDDGDLYGRARGDQNTYNTGRIGNYDVVLMLLPNIGNVSMAGAAASLRASYSQLKIVILAGICGGVPGVGSQREILLGDVIICKQVIQYDIGRLYASHFEIRNSPHDILGRPNRDIRTLVKNFETSHGRCRLQRETARFLLQLQEKARSQESEILYQYPGSNEDKLFEADYIHRHRTPAACDCLSLSHGCNVAIKASCDELLCDASYLIKRDRLEEIRQREGTLRTGAEVTNTAYNPAIFVGVVGSGDAVMKSGGDRDKIAAEHEIIAFETEGAGLWDELPCIVVKGVCDYADSHKNKTWQPYAAATAAAAVKALLGRYIQTDKPANRTQSPISDVQLGVSRQSSDAYSKLCIRTAAFERNLSGPLLRSEKIFFQESILIRDDVLSFLKRVLSDEGKARAVLYGLPGVGKTTMARYFANQEQATKAILWIPSGSELEIRAAFSEYSKILTSRDREPTNFVSVVGERLNELFANNWIIIFDGLDDHSAIPLETYTFPHLPSGKILITTQNASICDRINASHVMKVTPLDEKAAEDLLIMTTARPGNVNTANISESTGEAQARKRVLRELGYLPAAISIVAGILRGSLGSPQISCEMYLQRCDEARDEDLEESPTLANYHSVWKAFEICFHHFISDQTANSKRAAHLAYFVASFEDASNLQDGVHLYRLATRRRDQVQNNNQNHSFFRRSFDKLVSANFITGNWTKSGDDHVPYIEMHSLFKRWLQRTYPGEIYPLLRPKLWLLGFGMCRQLEHTGVETDRHSSLKSELRASIASHREHWSDNAVSNHELVVPFVLDAVRGLAKSIEILPVDAQQQPGLATYSENLHDSISEVYTDLINTIDWATTLDEFIYQLGDQVEFAVRFASQRKPDFKLKDFFLETLDASGCLPIAFKIASSNQFQLGGQIQLIEELKNVIVHNIRSLLSACLGSEATDTVADMCHMPHDERRSRGKSWVERWAGDVSEILKRGFDEAFSTVCRLGIDPGAPTPTSETAGTGQGQDLRLCLPELLIESDAMDILEAKSTEIRDVCENAIRRALGDRAGEVFHFQPLSSESDHPTGFSMLWELAWGGRVAGDFTEWVGSMVMDSISQDLKDTSIEELERFLRPHCESVAVELADDVKNDSGVSNIFLNWIISGWVDMPDDDASSDDSAQGRGGLGPDIHEEFGILRGQTTEALQAVYAGGQQASSREVVCRAVGGIFNYRRALHHNIMKRLAAPGLNDRTGLGPFFAKMFLEDCDKELVTIFSVLADEASFANTEELGVLQQVERNWRM